MKVARLQAPYQFEMLDEPIPEPGPGEVLLKNMCLGICTSDLQVYHGKHAYAAMPVTLGHEVSAVVEKVGEGVTQWKPGDRVVLQPQVSCGHCYPCRTGHANVCEDLKVIGIHIDGCACEYVVVPADKLYRLPDSISFEYGALIEPMAVGFGVVRRINEVTDIKGKKVCVVGAGPIGNLVAQACKAKGAGEVMITDILQNKLDLALRCGIDYAENTKDQTLAQAVVKCFGEDRADIIIDSAATPFVFQSILDASRKASIIVISGNYKDPVQLDVTKIQRREITLLGHMMYIGEEFIDSIEALENGTVKIDELITKVWPLDEYADAYKYIDDNAADVMKMVIKIGEE